MNSKMEKKRNIMNFILSNIKQERNMIIKDK